MTRQTSLFEAIEPSGSMTRVEISASSHASLNKTQRRFNRLTSRVQALRRELADWQMVMDRLRSRIAGELEPLQRELLGQQRRTVLLVDALIATRRRKGDGLTARRRERLRNFVIELAHEVRSAGPDVEIEAILARQSGMDAEEFQRTELEMAEALVSHVLGDQVTEGHTARNLHELFEQVDRRMHEDLEREALAREERQKQRETNRSRSERSARATVRELYRRLASAIHPDREADAARRDRKTELMQRVNQAYARDDVLDLLAVQIELEQIDSDGLANLPEQRLGHYCTLLDEQRRVLEQELTGMRDMGRSLITESPAGPHAKPLEYEKQFLRDLDALRREIEHARTRIDALGDPARRGPVIDALMLDFADDDDPLLEIMLDLRERRAARRPDKGRKSRRRKT
jgi:hypothetical protein